MEVNGTGSTEPRQGSFMRKILNSHPVWQPDMPSAPGVARNNWFFISGMAGIDDDTAVGFESQVSKAMGRLLSVAADAGACSDDLVKCNVYLKDMDRFEDFDRIYSRYFPNGIVPARYVYEMPDLLGRQEILIEAIGRIGNGKAGPSVCVDSEFFCGRGTASAALKAGNFVFTSAIPPLTADGRSPLVFDDQIRSAAKNMISVVEAAGGKKEDIVKVIVFLKDLDKFDHFNSIYREFFDKDKNPPARSCFGVSSFEIDCEVMLECVAYLGKDRAVLCSPDVPAYNLPFCQGIRAEDMVFVSGQVGCDKKLGGMPSGFEDQMNAVFHNMLSVAKEAGATKADFVRTTGYLVDEKDYEKFKGLYADFWGSYLPASICFKVSGISYDYAMEIDSHVVLERK